MACALTQGYSLGCIESVGGIKEIYFIELDNVASVTAAAGAASAITKEATKVFRKYSLEKETGDFESVLTIDRAQGSRFYDETVKFSLQKMTAAVSNEIKLLASNRLMAVVVDRNNVGWLFGYENGLTVTTASHKSGRAMGDMNGYDIELKGQEASYPLSVPDSLFAGLLT